MKLTVQLERQGYDVVVKQGVLSRVCRLTNLGGQVMVVSDSGVPDKIVKTVLAQCGQPHLFVMPQGEAQKTPKACGALVQTMLDADFGRGGVVACVGGGVPAAVAGAAAAAYMGGVTLCYFPTTLTAQLDACVGGLAALNLTGHKDVLRVLYQPAFVAADPALLQSLPARQIAAGFAAALKTALTQSPELFEVLETEGLAANLERLICLTLLLKKELIQRDAARQGPARLLGFGHTVGHGIEAVGEFCGLLHGECVALGMLPMIENRTLLRRTRALMRKLGLPLKHPYPPRRVLEGVVNSALCENGHFTVARVKTLGQGYLETIPRDELALLIGCETP